MNEDTDNWDTHSLQPYISEFIKPFRERDPKWEYSNTDVCQETFALILWKLQEEYHLDYQTAFLLAGEWRDISQKRIERMFGLTNNEEVKNHLWDTHPELKKIEKELPKRNLLPIRPYSQEGLAWMEISDEDLR